MLFLLITLPTILMLFALRWTFSPYFIWRGLSKTQIDNSLTIITRNGRESLSKYLIQKKANKCQIDYTLVIPAYNEEKRLPDMLRKTIEHFERMRCTYEIIVVSNTSTDRTTQIAVEYSEYDGKNIDIKALEYKTNLGKGEAVRNGCIAAEGDIILMVDADGASEISEFSKLLKELKRIERNGHGLVTGSRAVMDANVNQKRFGVRKLLSKLSNFFIRYICRVELKDTQCGFKLFTKKSAISIFRPLHIRRWAFDVEVFVIANELNIPYTEVAIEYIDQDGSKLNVITDSIQMARDYFLIRLFYLFKLWSKDHTDKIWDSLTASCPPEKMVQVRFLNGEDF